MIDTVKIKKPVFYLFPAVLSFVYAVFLIVFSEAAKQGAEEGLKICREVILTAVFPFSAAASLLISSGAVSASGRLLGGIIGKIFGVSYTGAGVILLGAVGGFPTGAYAASSLYISGELDKNEAERLISFTNNATPAFMIGYVGSLTGSVHTGVFCYVAVLVSAFIWGIIIRKKTAKKENMPPSRDGLFSFSKSVSKSASSAVIICGFVIVFSVISRIVSVLIGNTVFSCILCSSFEITSGVSMISSLSLPLRTSASLLGAVCAFSGICIYSQVKNEADEAGLSAKFYVFGKLFQAAAVFFIIYILYPLIFT